ncbi:MAG: hypothetical protein WCK64_03260 [Synechococcaceae cyanobacterium ELA445]
MSHGFSEWIDRFIFGPRRWRSFLNTNEDSYLQRVLKQVSNSGYACCEFSIDVDDLLDDLTSLMFVGRDGHDEKSLLELENKHSALKGRYDADNVTLLSLKSFAIIVTSEQINRLASAVLGPRFMVTSALVWASFPCDSEAQAIASAQVFHMDYDYLDDIKLFINLSDVDASSGPLEYVAASHRPGSKKIWSAEPVSVSTVWKEHPHSNRSLFTGPKGSLYISDNRGLHRDAPPELGSWKLAMQVNFSRNQFGSQQVYAHTRPKLSSQWPSYDIWRKSIVSTPLVYDLIFASHYLHA